MQKTFALTLPVFLLAMSLGAAAHAMSCAQSPFDEVAERADAIFTGRILEVRYQEGPEPSLLCMPHSRGELCGEKVARVEVDRVWKGNLDSEVHVYAEDGCFCLGSYFTAGDDMIFMVVRPEREISGLGRIDYASKFCGRTTPIEYAVRNGTIEALDTRFPKAD